MCVPDWYRWAWDRLSVFSRNDVGLLSTRFLRFFFNRFLQIFRHRDLIQWRDIRWVWLSVGIWTSRYLRLKCASTSSSAATPTSPVVGGVGGVTPSPLCDRVVLVSMSPYLDVVHPDSNIHYLIFEEFLSACDRVLCHLF